LDVLGFPTPNPSLPHLFPSLYQVYGRPTIVINYPKGIKAFYMKLNDDNETVAAMDILVPKIGELIGGSQRCVSVVTELSS
jgi:aspartyl/asparaginyl-tRNA synthetase